MEQFLVLFNQNYWRNRMFLLKRMTKLFVLGLALAGIAFTAGCNTVEGAGKDMQKGGEAIQKAAQ